MIFNQQPPSAGGGSSSASHTVTVVNNAGVSGIEVLDPMNGMVVPDVCRTEQFSASAGEYIFLYAWLPSSLTIEDENRITIAPTWSKSVDEAGYGSNSIFQVFCMPDSDVTITYVTYASGGGGS